MEIKNRLKRKKRLAPPAPEKRSKRVVY